MYGWVELFQVCAAALTVAVLAGYAQPGAARLERALVPEMAKAKMGDPLDETTTLGPMARRDLRDSLHAQVRRSIQLGARCLPGGEQTS